MTPLELLIAVAEGKGAATKKAVQLIGEERLAILIAKGILSFTSHELSATHVAEILKVNRTTAADRIDAASVEGTKQRTR